MNRRKKKITKKKAIIGIAVIIILIVIVVSKVNNNFEEVQEFDIEEIEKRTIAQSISATGVINTTDSKNVLATLTGQEILTVNVKKGDIVNPGDIICTFDTSSIQDNLKIAEESQSISQAQANIGLQSAQRNLNDAINNKNTQVSSSQDEVNKAQQAYNDAQNQLNSLNNTLKQKQTELITFENSTYNVALAAYNPVKAELDSKDATLKQITNDYNAKVAEKEYLQNTDPSSLNIAVLEQAISSTKASLDAANNEYLLAKTNNEIAYSTFAPIEAQHNALKSAIAELQTNKATLEATANNLKTAYDKTVQAHNSMVSTSDSTIANMRDSVANAELAANSSYLATRAQINAYKNQIEDGVVRSTVSGTVTSVNVEKGDIYTGATIATIEGCEEFIVQAEIDEYDIPDIRTGMKVFIKTDATRDAELEGVVTYVSASATSNASNGMTGMATGSSSNATYKIEIALNTPNDRLRLGMNAKLSIITEMEENVWSVPYNAIYERDNGTHYIEIAKNDDGTEKEELDVEKGIEGTYYTEIKSSKLKKGMKVIMPKINSGNSIENLIEMMGAEAGI